MIDLTRQPLMKSVESALLRHLLNPESAPRATLKEKLSATFWGMTNLIHRFLPASLQRVLNPSLNLRGVHSVASHVAQRVSEGRLTDGARLLAWLSEQRVNVDPSHLLGMAVDPVRFFSPSSADTFSVSGVEMRTLNDLVRKHLFAFPSLSSLPPFISLEQWLDLVDASWQSFCALVWAGRNAADKLHVLHILGAVTNPSAFMDNTQTEFFADVQCESKTVRNCLCYTFKHLWLQTPGSQPTLPNRAQAAGAISWTDLHQSCRLVVWMYVNGLQGRLKEEHFRCIARDPGYFLRGNCATTDDDGSSSLFPFETLGVDLLQPVGDTAALDLIRRSRPLSMLCLLRCVSGLWVSGGDSPSPSWFHYLVHPFRRRGEKILRAVGECTMIDKINAHCGCLLAETSAQPRGRTVAICDLTRTGELALSERLFYGTRHLHEGFQGFHNDLDWRLVNGGVLLNVCGMRHRRSTDGHKQQATIIFHLASRCVFVASCADFCNGEVDPYLKRVNDLYGVEPITEFYLLLTGLNSFSPQMEPTTASRFVSNKVQCAQQKYSWIRSAKIAELGKDVRPDAETLDTTLAWIHGLLVA